MKDDPYNWKLPPIPDSDVVVLSRSALHDFGHKCWTQGVKRGRFEERQSRTATWLEDNGWIVKKT